jgi:pimeloyl-ACP methyl ester carboxylesterase
VAEETFAAGTPEGPIAGHTGGAGAPVLLLHGGPAMSDYMDLLALELDGWRWIRYQQRGVPPSTTDGPFTVDQHVADAVAVLDVLGIERAVVLGHSWGGHLALQLALARPDRVAGLVIVDPLGAVGDGGVTEMGEQLKARLSPASAARFDEVEAQLEASGFSDALALESLTLVWPGYFAVPAAAPPLPSGMRLSMAASAETWASIAGGFTGRFDEKLGDVRIPAVFVLGEHSPMPVSQGEQTAALLPLAEVDVIPGAGHLPWHEQPGCVAAALAKIRARAGVP